MELSNLNFGLKKLLATRCLENVSLPSGVFMGRNWNGSGWFADSNFVKKSLCVEEQAQLSISPLIRP